MKLFYVRHGQTQANVEVVYAGHSETPLTNMGIAGAKLAGREILISGEQIDVIYSSNLKRQLETAQLIAKEIDYPVENIVIDDLLLERGGGDFEGKPRAELFAATEQAQVAVGAESLKELSERAVKLLEKLKKQHPEDTILLVGSATIGEMLRAMINHGNYTRVFDDEPLPNTALVRLI